MREKNASFNYDFFKAIYGWEQLELVILQALVSLYNSVSSPQAAKSVRRHVKIFYLFWLALLFSAA